MNNDLEKSVLRAICFFDALDLPLTLLEVWKNSDARVEINVLRETLAQMAIGISAVASETAVDVIKNISMARPMLGFDRGFYFLTGRQDLVSRRLSSYTLSLRKFKKARRFARLMSFFPWTRELAIFSSLSWHSGDAQSDIDFFLMAADGRLWSARFWANLFLKIFRLRPAGRARADKICLSYLADSQGVAEIMKLAANNLYYLRGTLDFIFLGGADSGAGRDNDSGGAIVGPGREFFFAADSLKTALPNHYSYSFVWPVEIGWPARSMKFLAEKIFGLMPEKFYRDFQEKILPRRFKDIANSDHRVIVSDHLIKLHDNCKSAKINREFAEKLTQETRKI